MTTRTWRVEICTIATYLYKTNEHLHQLAPWYLSKGCIWENLTRIFATGTNISNFCYLYLFFPPSWFPSSHWKIAWAQSSTVTLLDSWKEIGNYFRGFYTWDTIIQTCMGIERLYWWVLLVNFFLVGSQVILCSMFTSFRC